MQVLEAHAQTPAKTVTPKEAPENLPAMDAHFGAALGSKENNLSMQEVVSDFQKALSGNGYLRARGIRMKLLHQHICAISGIDHAMLAHGMMHAIPGSWLNLGLIFKGTLLRLCLHVRHLPSALTCLVLCSVGSDRRGTAPSPKNSVTFGQACTRPASMRMDGREIVLCMQA